jgi:predicted dehydrogenase
MTLPRRAAVPGTRPVRLGFVGVGWIGLSRMKALLDTGLAEAAALVDPNTDMVAQAKALAGDARAFDGLDAMLDHVDAVVIATPSALHAEQSIQAMDAGVAVFCQKPLGRSAAEVAAVVEAARRNDLPLGLDLSYRHTAAMKHIRGLVADGTLGPVHTIDLVFHNGYGPDKAWFYDRQLSGGGCLMDLGIHLVDLALWAQDFPPLASATGHFKRAGAPWNGSDGTVEHLAFATLVTQDGTLIRLACSWKLDVGRDAEISATFHGTRAAARFANVGGSFYDFTASLLTGTSATTLVSGPDDWGGRAALHWLGKVQAGGFDADCLQFAAVADALDRIYAAGAAADAMPAAAADAAAPRGAEPKLDAIRPA